MRSKRDATPRIIREMLGENTGVHMLDSGGAYGRNWEQNQGRDWNKEPETTLEVEGGEVMVKHNVYHFLKNALDYAPEFQRKFKAFSKTGAMREENWLTIMEAFPEYLRGLGHEVDNQGTVNTYNGEDLLSQILQYAMMEVDGKMLVLLQIHGGCDVRGGYTAPRAFFFYPDGDLSLFDNARAWVGCKGKGHVWACDDACNFMWEGEGKQKNLEEFDLTKGNKDRTDVITGVLCPLCGDPLTAWY